MSEMVAEAMRAIDRAEPKTYSRQGRRELDQARYALQSGCLHRLNHCDKNDSGYRYQCKDCGKLLKIRSGILLDTGKAVQP